MKRIILSALVLLLAISVTASLAQEKMMQEKAMKEKETTIKGEVVDVACYLHQGAKGDGHRACAIACAKGGGALGILTADGTVYLALLPDDHKESPNAKLIDHAAHQVEVMGYVREKGGVKGIMITGVATAKMDKMEKKY